ncbi:MAG TPA: glycosyltransferase [Thermoanaerobaculia bacterium]|nr:glycosyltransferase [Thermoanaerobaculia bacterium]
MRPTVSILIPNLDSPLVDRTLAALAAQGAPGPEIEVLVVGRDAPGLVPRDSAVRFLETAERLSPAAARNRAVAAAQGDRFLFIDADCRPLSGWIEKLRAALDDTPVAGGGVTFPRDPAATSVWALADNIASFHELLTDRPAERDTRGAIGSLNLGLRREAWETVGPFDETLPTSEDFDWILRARRAGLATAFVPDAVVEHAAVRRSRAELQGHAAWYGRHFHRFRTLHPGVFDRGPTWRSRAVLRASAPLKAVTGALSIFRKHPSLSGCWRAFPGVVAFRRAWYRAVVEGWE